MSENSNPTFPDPQSLIKKGQFYFIYDSPGLFVLEDKTKRGLEVREKRIDEKYNVQADIGVHGIHEYREGPNSVKFADFTEFDPSRFVICISFWRSRIFCSVHHGLGKILN